MLATKISFMNELANLAERLGAGIVRVRIDIGSDPRIGFQFIWPGCGYGGSKGLAGRRFALWGLAFKPNTDDMRDASASLSRGHRRWAVDTHHHEERGHRRRRCPGDLHRMEAVYGSQLRSVGIRPAPQVDL
jgi:UDP-N-acetyl-D-mannosaminuronate dehydrogenase